MTAQTPPWTLNPIPALIVDNYPYFRRTLQAHVEESFRVRVVATASSGSAAAVLVEKLGPRLVIMKIHLPDVDGLEVCRRMKIRNPALRVILYSIYTPNIYTGCAGFCADACISQDSLFEQLPGIIGTFFPLGG